MIGFTVLKSNALFYSKLNAYHEEKSPVYDHGNLYKIGHKTGRQLLKNIHKHQTHAMEIFG